MSDLNAKALKAAVTAFSDTAAMNGTGNECLAAAIRTYLSASGIGAVVEAARATCDAHTRLCGEWRADVADYCMDELCTAVAALDKEPSHD